LNPQAYEKLCSLADEVCRREGCRLYDLEFQANPKSRILRVFIDAEKEAVSVEQCANVSRGLSLLLDVEDLIPGDHYDLEVSSPGIERLLRQPWHYERAMGQEVKIVTHEPVEGLKGEVKSLTGPIKAAETEGFVVVYQDGEVRIPYRNVKRAQVVFGFKKNEKKR
jgi:ribosome maturation factor RimP